MAGVKRNRLQGPPPTWDVLSGMLHKRLHEAAAELNVPITYLRRLCHLNGYVGWPGKRMRYLNSIGNKPMLDQVAAPESGIPEPDRKELVTLNLIDKVGSSSSSEGKVGPSSG